MNTKTTISAIVMFAAVLGMVSFAPAFAAKADKINVCHFEEAYYQGEDTDLDGDVDADDEGSVYVPAEWKVININGNAASAHVGVHTDSVYSDSIVNDSDGDSENDTDDCLARNNIS